jgi:hypothetical protein
MSRIDLGVSVPEKKRENVVYKGMGMSRMCIWSLLRHSQKHGESKKANDVVIALFISIFYEF